MKILRKGITTGTCAAAATKAVALWQSTGNCPSSVKVIVPAGYEIELEIKKLNNGCCGVIKDAGDDPDVTDKMMIISKVRIFNENGLITYKAGEGVGIVTVDGLKVQKGEPAINPVPRKQIEDELRKIIDDKCAEVTISIPGGEEVAKKTFNPKMGIVGGLSIIGTTGIVRPMSEEAMKDSIALELQMKKAQGTDSMCFVIGASGEKSLNQLNMRIKWITHVSNYIGAMLDVAEELGYKHILIWGFGGKLIKLAANIMNTHSHVAEGRREILCTVAALKGADRDAILELYNSPNISEAIRIAKKYNLHNMWQDIVEEASKNCILRTHNKIEVAVVFLENDSTILAKSNNYHRVLKELEQ